MPSVPAAVTAGAATATTLDLTWTDPNNPDVEIRAYWRVAGDVTWILDATLVAGLVEYTFGESVPLAPGTDYEIGVSAWDDPDESAIVSVSASTIDGVSFVYLTTTLIFKPGNIQATRLYDEQRKRNLVSTNGTVRIVEMSATNDRFIELDVVALPRTDDSPFSGYDSLRTFLLTTINWAEQVWTFHDNDGDSFLVRIWPHTFDLFESRKDEFDGFLLLRVEA